MNPSVALLSDSADPEIASHSGFFECTAIPHFLQKPFTINDWSRKIREVPDDL
jgi:hypothetical protein